MKNKVVIITGGSSGIGKALAFAFGREGAKIVISGRNLDKLHQVSQALSLQSIDNLTFMGDVSQEADCQRMIEETIKRFERIDVLINNAGITMRAMFEEADTAVIRKVMDTNFFGMVYSTKYALPYLKETKGSIIGISSIAGYRGLPVRTGYSASKFAMNGFLEALRTELLHTGVHVLTACPGFTTSNIRVAAIGKNGQVTGESVRDEENMMTAEAVANRIVIAVKNRKRQLLLTTQGWLTVLVNRWFPKLMDRIVYNTLAKEKDSPLKRKD